MGKQDKVATAYGMDSRTLEHMAGQSKDIARRGSVPKSSGKPVPVHPGMANRTDTTLGAPPRGVAPDASGPSPLDPTHAGKSFKVPALAMGHKSHPLGSKYDPGLAHAIFDAATRAPDDYAKSLHTELPQATDEE